MGIVHEDGHNTNIVMGDRTHGNVWGLAPLDDPLETDPARRYKAIYEIGPPGFRVADELPGANVRRAYSADSIHWTTYDEPPMFGGLGAKQGDGIFPFFDPETRTYCILTRHPWMEMAPRPRVGLVEQAIAGGSTTDPAHGLSNRRGMRRIFFAQSRDFHHWSEPRLALAPDPELDNLDDSFYCMRPYRLGSHWVGFLGRAQHDHAHDVPAVGLQPGRAPMGPPAADARLDRERGEGLVRRGHRGGAAHGGRGR